MPVLPLRKFRNSEELKSAHDGEIVRTLNDRYAKLNEQWAEAEANLKRFPIPREVRCCIDGDDNYASYLGFVKVKGSWRICWAVTSNESDEYPQWCPIAECSLDVRMRAVEHHMELYKAVKAAAIETVDEIDAAITKLSLDLV